MPKIVDHAQYRKQLLMNCFDLFADKGYAAITMRQIAQGLGVSTGTLYHYFPSKEVLFEQFVEEMSARDLAQIATALEAATSPAERLEIGYGYLADNRDYFFKQMLIYVDFYQQQEQAACRSEVLQKLDQQIEQVIANILGINHPGLVRLVLAHVDGLIFGEMYGEDSSVIKQQAKLLAQLLTPHWQNHSPGQPPDYSQKDL
jgi:AcrR family transcriptional regulator